MVATVEIHEANGGTDGNPGTKTKVNGVGVNDGTDVRFCTKDAFNPVATSPCIIPPDGTGFNYSFWKHLFLDISGTYTTLNHIRFYTDGTISWTLGTGGGLYVGIRTTGDNGCPMDASYEVATGVVNTSGDTMDGNHSYYTGASGSVVDAKVYKSDATLDIDSTSYGPNAAVDSNAVVLQVKLDTSINGCVQGTQVDETLTFIYDEI